MVAADQAPAMPAIPSTSITVASSTAPQSAQGPGGPDSWAFWGTSGRDRIWQNPGYGSWGMGSGRDWDSWVGGSQATAQTASVPVGTEAKARLSAAQMLLNRQPLD